jgi:D-alanyl-D-alanine carboxypeptidase (penicillin-binding protein 5/6)
MVGNPTCAIKKFNKVIILLIILFYLMLTPSLIADAQGVKSSSIVIEASSGRVLDGYNINLRLPMASTTKIVTALVVIENADINKVITIHPKAVGIEGSSIYLKAGEKWTIKDLLYGMMLRSGNDAAMALALHVGGSVEAFSDMMNKRARKIGLADSNFINPHGLHDDNHYTSAYDLAMLTRECMKYDIFKEIVSCKSYLFSRENVKSVFYNKNKMLKMYEGANGVKTGFTKKSGRCLVSSAIRGGMQLITVTLNIGNMWGDSMALMNKAFQEYRMHNLLEKGDIIGKANVVDSSIKSAVVISKDTVCYPLRDDEADKISYRLQIDTIKAPVSKDSEVGKLQIFLDNRLLFSVNAYTIEDINKMSAKDRFKGFFQK